MGKANDMRRALEAIEKVYEAPDGETFDDQGSAADYALEEGLV